MIQSLSIIKEVHVKENEHVRLFKLLVVRGAYVIFHTNTTKKCTYL